MQLIRVQLPSSAAAFDPAAAVTLRDDLCGCTRWLRRDRSRHSRRAVKTFCLQEGKIL